MSQDAVWHAVCTTKQHMEEMRDNLTIIIGATQTAEQLRSHLVRRQVWPAAACGHLRKLRGWLYRRRGHLVVLCVDLDTETLDRHGDDLRTLLDDQSAFPGQVCSIGVLPENFDARAVETGCDVYVVGLAQASSVIEILKAFHNGRDWREVSLRRDLPTAVRERLEFLFGQKAPKDDGVGRMPPRLHRGD